MDLKGLERQSLSFWAVDLRILASLVFRYGEAMVRCKRCHRRAAPCIPSNSRLLVSNPCPIAASIVSFVRKNVQLVR
jgi:hypothetical protein